jgi:hypothetical protein
MSKILADLLDQPQTIVETAIARLEHLSGYESTDVRLLADINNQVRAKTAALGLDPDDTTSEELYHALRAKITTDNRVLTKRIGLNSVNSPETFVRRFVEFIQHADIHPEIWALKWSTAKKMLREHPPKKLMKHLGYRSVESMLKRESTGEILAALPHVESERWLNVFWRELASVNPSEFEDRRVQIVVMYPGRWGRIAASSFVETLPHTGVIALWLGQDIAKLGALGLGLQLFEAVATLKAESSYLKLKQFEGGFGEQLLQVVKHDLHPLLKFTGLKVDWRTICHYLGKLDAASHAAWSPPHVSHEDIHTHKPLDILSRLDPALNWWSGLEHAAINLPNKSARL